MSSECQCEPNPKVIPISRAKIRLESPHSEVDQRILEALQRSVSEAETRSRGPREIELFADDIKALESQRFFKKRFGFTLGRRGREALFEVIDQYDLTDEEVRALNRVDCFDWDGKTLRVSVNRWIGLMGSLYVAGMFLMSVLLSSAISLNPNHIWRVEAALWLALSLTVFATAWIYRQFLAPFRLFRRRRIVESVRSED